MPNYYFYVSLELFEIIFFVYKISFILQNSCVTLVKLFNLFWA